MEKKREEQHEKPEPDRQRQDRSTADDRSRADNPDYRGPDPQGGRGNPSQAEGDR